MLLALALLLGQPSGFACTFDRAIGGGRCVYEAEPAPGKASDNSKAAATVGSRACAAAAGRDESLRKDCEKAIAEASLSGKCAIEARLADGEGYLTPQAQGCVEALREAVARTSRAAALSLDCCRCLGESRCAVPASQCKRELADLMPGAALKSCLAKSCSDACAFVAPPAREPEPPPPPKDPSEKI